MFVDCNDAPVVPDAIAVHMDGLDGDVDEGMVAALARWQAFCRLLAERYGFCQVWLNRVEAGYRLQPMIGTGVLPAHGCPRSCSVDSGVHAVAGYSIVRDFCEDALYRLWYGPHSKCMASRHQAAGAAFACRWTSPQGRHFALTLHAPSKFRRPEPSLVDELTALARALKDLFETGSAMRPLPRRRPMICGLRPIYPEDRYPQY